MNVPGIAFLILGPIALGGLSIVTYGYGSQEPNYNILWAPVLIIVELILIITGVIQL